MPTCCPAKVPSLCQALHETLKNKYNWIGTQELPHQAVQGSCRSVICCQHNLSGGREGRAWLSFLIVGPFPNPLYPMVGLLFLQALYQNAHSKPLSFSQLLGMALPFAHLFQFFSNPLIFSSISTSQSHEFHKRTCYLKL